MRTPRVTGQSRHEQDETGQWWYVDRFDRRFRAEKAECNWCHEEFVVRCGLRERGKGRFCSPTCGNRSKAERRRGEPRQTFDAPQVRRDSAGQWWYYHRDGRRQAAEPRVCDECNVSYVARVGKVKGKPSRYCSRTCANRATARANSGEASVLWKGGRSVHSDGYVRVWNPEGRYLLEHRVVMSEHLGRPLGDHETVHHKNANRSDNRLENLELRIGAHGQGATAPHCRTCTCFDHG